MRNPDFLPASSIAAVMHVRIGDITAKCPQCGKTEFRPAGSGPQRKLECIACGAATTRAALLDQIGEEAIRQARESLLRLRSRPPVGRE